MARLLRALPRGRGAASCRRSSTTRTRCRCRGSTRSCINMAVGEGGRGLEEAQPTRSNELAKISGQKPVDLPGAQVGRQLQAARGHADRLQGDLAPAAHVRVPRPADQHRPAARPRLPRRVAEELRRPRQLRVRASKEQIIFPEINFDEVEETRGMDIIICTTAQTDAEAKALLAGFDMPFRK